MKIERILEEIIENGKKVAKIEATQEAMLETQNLVVESIDYIRKQDEIQNRLLDEHIRGVNQNTERLEIERANRKDLEKRIVQIERYERFFKYAKNSIIGIGCISGAIYAIIQLIEKLG